MITTDEVLTEFLAALSASAPNLWRQAAKMVRAIFQILEWRFCRKQGTPFSEDWSCT